MLSAEEQVRYAAHFALPGVGVEGQARLRAARVALVGAGGLGSPASLYLAAAGVGTLTLIDSDAVELGNLQRQIAHRTDGIGRPKVASAADALTALNPGCRVDPVRARLTDTNAATLLAGHDVVIDACDNYPTRYLVNDTCARLGLPWVHGSVWRFGGQASVFGAPDAPCYRCLYPDPPEDDSPTTAATGLLGPIPGIVGTLQATEALKLLLGIGTSLAGRLLLVDALTMTFRAVTIARDPLCPSCGVPAAHA